MLVYQFSLTMHYWDIIIPKKYCCLKFNLTECPVFYLIVKGLNLGEILSSIQGKPSIRTPSNFYDNFVMYISNLLIHLLMCCYYDYWLLGNIHSTLTYMPSTILSPLQVLSHLILTIITVPVLHMKKNGDTKIINFPTISKLVVELGRKLGQSQASGLIFLTAALDCL